MADERKKMEGEVVVFVDSVGQEHLALVTRDHGGIQSPRTQASLNVVYVVTNEEKTDTYGRQIARETSVVHQSCQSAPGNHWKDLGE